MAIACRKSAGTEKQQTGGIGGEKKRKKSGKSGSGQGAFDTLQLSDGGIVSYELYAKRNERGDELLFSRPNTKQSWVGSLGPGGSIRGSPAVSSRLGGVGIYGSIDGGDKTPRAQSQLGAAQLPNMYSALATDSIPMLAAGNGANGQQQERNGRCKQNRIFCNFSQLSVCKHCPNVCTLHGPKNPF